jgi:RHS repeat-associated protein
MVAEYSNDQPQANGTSYLTQDTLGSTRAVTGQDQVVKVRHDYFPFGEEVPADGTWRTSGRGYDAGDGVRQKFTGKERDNETGLDYFLARFYSSVQGRFTGVDTAKIKQKNLINPQELNRYAYVNNNPLNSIDPDGMETIVIIIRTFIPQPTVNAPNSSPIGPAVRTFKGDDRNIGEHPERYRTEQRIAIETDPNKNGGKALLWHEKKTGITTELKYGGEIHGKAPGDTLKASAHHQTNEGVGPLVLVNAKGNEHDPLVPEAPGITYNIKFYVQSSGPDGAVSIGVDGEHDGFPAYEIFVQRPESSNKSEQFITGYDPRTENNGPSALIPGVAPKKIEKQKTLQP